MTMKRQRSDRDEHWIQWELRKAKARRLAGTTLCPYSTRLRRLGSRAEARILQCSSEARKRPTCALGEGRADSQALQTFCAPWSESRRMLLCRPVLVLRNSWCGKAMVAKPTLQWRHVVYGERETKLGKSRYTCYGHTAVVLQLRLQGAHGERPSDNGVCGCMSSLQPR